MKYRFIAAHRDRFHITRMCRVLGVSTSGYYTWFRRTPSHRARSDQALLGHIRVIHSTSRQT